MTETSPGIRADSTSSPTQLDRSGHDGDAEEPTDSSYESALLAEDPLEDEGQPRSVISQALGSTVADWLKYEL